MPFRNDDHHNHGGAPPPPKPKQKFLFLILKTIIMTIITTFFFLFLAVAAIIVLLATSAVHGHSSYSSSPSSDDLHGRIRNGLSPKDIKKLPSPFKFSSLKRPTPPTPQIQQSDQCVVCLDSMRGGQWCRRLVGCGHVFHSKCVDTWIVKVSTCPICRTPVRLVVPEEDVDHSHRPPMHLGFDCRNDFGVW